MSNHLLQRQEDLERQPMVLLVCGETGVGKTYRNKLEIRRYLQDLPALGKKGRKVLSFDTNDDDYPEFRSVSPDHLHLLSGITPRRIRPFNPNGSPMTHAQKREVVSKILAYFRDGLIVLDDIDHYMAGAKGQSMISALVSVRHMGIDLLLTHQSISKITTTEWEASTILRLHHQVDNVSRYKARIPNYQIIRIAQLIINDQYNLASRRMARREISPKEAKRRKSYFVYVDTRNLKIIGCSRKAFIKAALKYIDQEESKTIRMMLNERHFNKASSLKYNNRNEAVTALLSEYLHFHEEPSEEHFSTLPNAA
ncbi:MAG: zonular occludens toxin domain-containing protein [Bacteroidota bacterium]